MKLVVAFCLAGALLADTSPAFAQHISIEAQRATRAYKAGWDAYHQEAWADAARSFQQAIEIDPNYALAYYSLGRTEMQRRDFPKAIAAYLKCRNVYLASQGQAFANQVDARKHLDDQLLEYRTALTQANQVSGPKSGTQSQSLLIREIEVKISRLEMAKDRNINMTVDTSVPFFVSMALGTAYFRNTQFTEAEREFKAAIDANAASGETHNNLAVLYMSTGRLDEAAAEIKLAEGTGYKVNPEFKRDLEEKRKRKSP